MSALFAGLNFFITQRTPSRNYYVSQIESHGGRVVRIEGQADHIIADHMKPAFCPTNSLSYTFIDTAISNGELPETTEHIAGKPAGSVRIVGSAAPTKGTRTPFTLEDDQALWTWVEKCRNAGEFVKGNKIYQLLEQRNNRHTYHAWRDRYLKKLSNSPAPPGCTEGAVDSEDEVVRVVAETKTAEKHTPSIGRTESVQHMKKFSVEEYDALYDQISDILDLDEDNIEAAWEAWAQAKPSHSAEEWQSYFKAVVLPAYEKEEQANSGNGEQLTVDESDQGGGEIDGEVESKSGANDTEVNAEQCRGNLERQRSTSVDLHTAQSKRRRQEHIDLQEDAVQLSQKRRRIEISPSIQIRTPEISSQTNSLEKNIEKAESSNGMDRDEESRRVVQHPGVGKEKPHVYGDLGSSHQDMIEEVRSRSESPPAPERSNFSHQGYGDELTEANLTKQQAMHQAQILRATDLPADDEMQDQSEYIQYLRNIQGLPIDSVQSQRVNSPKDPPVQQPIPKTHEQVSAADSVSLRGDEHRQDWPPGSEASDLPQSSPIENIRKRGISRETEMPKINAHAHATHIQQSSFFNEAMEDAELSSQPFGSQTEATGQVRDGNKIVELLLNPEAECDHATDAASLDPSSDSYHEIDLTIPEPDGGFDLSSPIRSQLSNHSHRYAHLLKPPNPALVNNGKSQYPLHESISEDGQTILAPRKPICTALDTQGYLNAETQKPDFSIPFPPESDDNESLPHVAVNTSVVGNTHMMPDVGTPLEHATTTTSNNGSLKQETNSVNRDLKSRRAEPEQDSMFEWIGSMLKRKYDEATIIWALERTTMRPELAELVLYYHKKGKGLPTDIPGTWSEEEDKILWGQDAKGLAWLEEKHGGKTGQRGWEEMNDRMTFLGAWNKHADEEGVTNAE